jgi:hypothetical protein
MSRSCVTMGAPSSTAHIICSTLAFIPGAIALLVSTVLLSPRVTLAQTLDELQDPLLTKGQVTIHADDGQFSFERAVAGVGFQPYTYFEPPYHILLPTVSLGVSRKVQFNVSGTYLFPGLRSSATFPGAGSSIDHWLVKSLQAEVVVRPSDRMEIGVAYLTGRSRYDSAFPSGNGSTVVDTFTTNALQVRGVWLPQPDRESRPLRADLDGLTGPLLRRHRAKLEWNVLWRRYGSTDYESDPLDAGSYISDTVRSSDMRVRVGAGYSAAERLQVTSDVYWQPPFTVADPIFVHDVFAGEDRVDDESRRLSDVFGWRLNTRWRPAVRVEAFAETTYEHESVLNGPATRSPGSDDFRQLRVSAGATWLSHSPAAGAPLAADLSGLYRPLLERNQLRLDAVLHFLRDCTNSIPTDEKLWRVGATLGVWSFMQANVYAGRFNLGDGLFEKGTSFGAGMRIRPAKSVEAYATLNYHPLTSIDRYPAFILPRGSFARSYLDFTDTTYDDDASIHIGIRLVL